MKRLRALAAVGLMSPCLAADASAVVLVDEDFESYATTAELGNTWNLGDGTLNTSAGNPGQSMLHPATSPSFSGGNTNFLGFTPTDVALAGPLQFSVDIFDDATSSNKRTSAGIRKASGSNIIELGMYNSPSHYAYRIILFGPGDPSWVAFDNLVDDSGQPIDNVPVEGWHTFSALVTATQITLTLDLNGDGFINATAVQAIAPVEPVLFDIVRLGGPSDLSSLGGGVSFDNVLIQTVPEPATGVLAALGLLTMGRRRRGA